MATLGALVEIVAAVAGISRERVEAMARAVREAGLIATHGRGPSAAQMAETDAANLLIAVNAAETARSAPETVRRFRVLRANNKAKYEFGSVLDGMIAAATKQELSGYLLGLGFGSVGKEPEMQRSGLGTFTIKVEFELSRPMAIVKCRIPAIDMPKSVPFFPPREKRGVRVEADRRTITTITERTILAVAEMMRR